MNYYFAPIQGITDIFYRRIHYRMFPGITKYFTPFLSPIHSQALTTKEKRELQLLPDDPYTVPQLLVSTPEPFISLSQQLAEYGFREINLNMGCPSGTVTAKGKGSGLLRNISSIRTMLDSICSKSVLPVSIKMRLGWSSEEEFTSIFETISHYPLLEIIVHARTRQQFYSGYPRIGSILHISNSPIPIIYNGDLHSPQKLSHFLSSHPQFPACMIGRGLIANPALVRFTTGGLPLNKKELFQYHETVLETILAIYPIPAVLGRMRDFSRHIACCFEDCDKVQKKLRKSQTLSQYNDSVKELFNHQLRNDPGFLSDEQVHALCRRPSPVI